MNAFIIFDVSRKNADVKASLKLMGYHAAWLSNGHTYYLPHNSMWKPNCELAQANNDLIDSISKINNRTENIGNPITIDRCIVLSVNPWHGLQGKPS